MITIIEKIILEREDKKVKEELILPIEDSEIERVFKRFKGHNFGVKLAYSNVGIAICDTNKELIGLENLEKRNISNLQYEDIEIFKEINHKMKELNELADIDEVKALTDYITTNIDDLLGLVQRKQYKVIPYKNDKEIGDYYTSALANESLTSTEGYYKTGTGYLNFYDKDFKKEHSGNELVYKIPSDYKEGICSICGKPYHNWGHNADPVNYGRCCDSCQSIAILEMRKFNSYASKTGITRRFRMNVEEFNSMLHTFSMESTIKHPLTVIPKYRH